MDIDTEKKLSNLASKAIVSDGWFNSQKFEVIFNVVKLAYASGKSDGRIDGLNEAVKVADKQYAVTGSPIAAGTVKAIQDCIEEE